MPNCCPQFHPQSPVNLCPQNFQDHQVYFEDIEELRAYIIKRESERRLEDLANVEDGIGNYAEGQILFFDSETQMWTLASEIEAEVW
ncbi:MAG: hypothetical protein ACRC80_34725 [Waterburya sp.]